MFAHFTVRARRAVVMAQEEATRMHHPVIGAEHIFLGVLAEGREAAARALGSMDVRLEEARRVVGNALGEGTAPPTGHVPFTPEAKKLLETSLREALGMGRDHIGAEQILLGLIRMDHGPVKEILDQVDGGAEAVGRAVMEEMKKSGRNEREGGGNPGPQPARAGGREPRSGGSSILDVFGADLTLAAREGKLDPVIGRSREIDRMMQILARRTKNNPVLIGEPGVGKSAIVAGFAQRIADNEVPHFLADKMLYSIDMGALVAGARFRGDFEQRIEKVLREVKKRGDVFIFLDEIHTMVGAGAAEGSIDAASMLKPMLAGGELRTIGATTSEEYRKYLERNPALARRFQPIRVEEPSTSDAVDILMGLRDRYESFHRVSFTDGAIAAAVRLANRYISDRFLPDKAIDLIDGAGSRKKLHSPTPAPKVEELDHQLSELRIEKSDAIRIEDYKKAATLRDREKKLLWERSETVAESGESNSALVIDEDEIAEALAQWTGIPVQRLTEKESARLMNMEEELRRRILGQDEAIAAVSRAIRRTRAGLKDPGRPAGSFIFLGPSGVGKTETAKALAEFLFGKEDVLIRMDMSEYMEKHAASRLVGSPPGYVGYEEGGQLTEAVRRRPFSVVLFDEIEKAHPDVFNTLLQILEDGRLTDSHGKTVDFKNAVIIMTSNLGNRQIHKTPVGFHSESSDGAYELVRERLTDELEKHFRPEFLNRVDEVIVYKELEMEEIKQIAARLMRRTVDQLRSRRLELVLGDSAKDFLARKGYDPESGARPLRRAIRRHLEDPLSERILAGDFEAGSTILVSLDEDSNALGFEGFKAAGDRSEAETPATWKANPLWNNS